MKVIIFSGPSGSGKTTISKNLSIALKNSLLISTDDYYKTGLISRILSHLIDSYFDKLISLNSNIIRKDIKEIINKKRIKHLYKYNFRNKKTIKMENDFKEIKFLIIEGIFSTELLELINEKDLLLVNLKTKKEECLKRILIRDVEERGKSKEIIIKDFFKSWRIYHRRENEIIKNKRSNILTIKNDPDIEFILKEIAKLN